MNDPNPAVTHAMYETFRQSEYCQQCVAESDKEKAIELAFKAGVSRLMHRLKNSAAAAASRKMDGYYT